MNARPEPSSAVDLSREGSAYDKLHGRRPSKKPWRRVRGWVTDRLSDLAAALVPWLYVLYCRFVWWTSRLEDRLGPLERALTRHGKAVALLWHQEVFTVAYTYRRFRPHTVASVGRAGRVITRMLEVCGGTVFRGGSSKGTARRRRVLTQMMKHLRQAEPPCLYGITVDGSHGPVFRMKNGAAVLARTGRVPVVLVRTWYRRRLELPTWDRTGIPLPFNRIVFYAVGPYWLDPDAPTADYQRACEHLEAELLELCDLSYREVDGRPDPRTRAEFPPGWTPRWSPFAPGLKHGPWDLQEEELPPWASERPTDPRPFTVPERLASA